MNALRQTLDEVLPLYHKAWHPGYATVAECRNPTCVQALAVLTAPSTDPTAALRTAAQAVVDRWFNEAPGHDARALVMEMQALRAALAPQADDPSGPDVDAAWEALKMGLIAHCPDEFPQAVLAVNANRPIIEAAIRADPRGDTEPHQA